jgi:hypothetical protein
VAHLSYIMLLALYTQSKEHYGTCTYFTRSKRATSVLAYLGQSTDPGICRLTSPLGCASFLSIEPLTRQAEMYSTSTGQVGESSAGRHSGRCTSGGTVYAYVLTGVKQERKAQTGRERKHSRNRKVMGLVAAPTLGALALRR